MGDTQSLAPWLLTGMGGVLGLGAAAHPPQAIHVIAGQYRPAVWPVTPAVRVNLAQRGALARIMGELSPGVVVHAACVSRAADCENHPAQAQAVNVAAVEELLASASAASSFVVYVSTEQVFDGTQERYFEHSCTAPRTLYGRTKAAAERLVLAYGGAVVRLPLLLGGTVEAVGGASGGSVQPRSPRLGADSALAAALRAGKRPQLFSDEIRCPVHVDFVASALWRIARQRAAGIFHLAGADAVSRFELGAHVCAAAGIAANFDTALASRFKGPPRSLRLVLDCQRARKEIGWESPDLRQSLARTFAAPLAGGHETTD